MTDTTTIIELVRHAKAQSRNNWWGKSDRQRPLTKAGLAQAKGLATELSGAAVTRIITSPFTRCVQTVEPLAARLGVAIEKADALGESPGIPVLDGGDAWVTSAWLGGRAVGLIDQLVTDQLITDQAETNQADAEGSTPADEWDGGQPDTDELDSGQPGHIVLCSHGDVVPSVMAALSGRDGLTLSDVHLKKGARFTLTFKGSKCIAAEAVPPP